jgi:hypothetical protein
VPTVLLEIDNLTACNKKIDIPGWYGSEVLDIGFIQVRATETPAAHLASDSRTLVCGREIAIAGFPMGTDALVFFAAGESPDFLSRSICWRRYASAGVAMFIAV